MQLIDKNIIILIKIIATITGIGIVFLTLKYAGLFLVINEMPKKADVIIILRGDPVRTQFGISLYHQGYAPYILFTSSTEALKEQAIGENVPEKAIILDPHARNTYENAIYSKALMGQYNLRSAIVVSSNYHMRRADLTFLKVFKGTGVSFTFCSVADPNFDASHWWSNGSSIRIVLREYGGIVALYLGLEPYLTEGMIRRTPLRFIF